MSILSCPSHESSQAINPDDRVQINPLETFRASMDYAEFEVQIICPYMHAMCTYDTLFSETKLPIMFSPGRPSLDELVAFLKETDYNSISFSLPIPPTPGNLVEVPHHYTPQFLMGCISRRKPDCFVWEAEFFEKGSEVILGKSGSLRLWQGYVDWGGILL
jgi:hypothetical protein